MELLKMFQFKLFVLYILQT